ncbi:hypothetical protein ACTFIW_009895 [Dictyostelium discoideum]
MLIKNGADLIGMSQDDMSCQKAMMDSGLIGIGATGYLTHLLFGGNVGVSYITNWTNLYLKYAQHFLNDDWPDYSSYFTNLSREDSISIDDYSYKVPIDIQNLVDDEIQRLKNTSYIPYRSDPYLAQLGIPFDSISKVIDFGQYSIPIEFIYYPNSLKYGVTIVSGVCIFICLVCMTLVVVFKKSNIFIIDFIGIIFAACILFSQSPTNQTCSARIWLLSLGYTLFLGNLLVKNWRIWLLFDNPKLKKRAITNWKLYPWVFAILAIDVMVLAIWQGLGNINAESRIEMSIVTNILKTVDVKCSDEDMAIFTFPKSFNTCQNYTSAFESYGPSGYVTKDATLNGEPACGYCIYKNGEEYYQTLDWSADNRWRNVGIIISFFVFNILMVILFIYLTRKGSR